VRFVLLITVFWAAISINRLPVHLDAAATTCVVVHVVEGPGAKPIPCRITVVDEKGNLAAFDAKTDIKAAIRKGVYYTAIGEAKFSVASGNYTIYATRGPEYSLASRKISAGAGSIDLKLSIRKEVDTKGYVSCDTHIHTLTFSGHGDSTAEERMVTLAAEGIELPISTEHNRNIDYTPITKKVGVDQWFTPITGNEVTTGNAHFNAFPINPGSEPPDYKLTNWKQMLANIRATPGVNFVTINHTTDLHSGFRPADPSRFHPLSGEDYEGRDWDVDGMELVNSSAQQSDIMAPYRVWFALLNHGKRIVGMGASDSHDVNEYIVSQGRTYIWGTRSLAQNDVNVVMTNLKKGRALVSCGLLTDMTVDGLYKVGDMVPRARGVMTVAVKVQAPSWIQADQLDIYSNGKRIAGAAISPKSAGGVKADISFVLERPRHDVWLVAVATGPGITAQYWPLSRPYQPTKAEWEPRVVGSTNVIWIDADGDGTFSSPHDYAVKAVDQAGGSPDRLMQILAGYDEATTVQAAAVCRARGMNDRSGQLYEAALKASPQVALAWKAYLHWLPDGK
jgi:hypothetical protein